MHNESANNRKQDGRERSFQIGLDPNAGREFMQLSYDQTMAQNLISVVGGTPNAGNVNDYYSAPRARAEDTGQAQSNWNTAGFIEMETRAHHTPTTTVPLRLWINSEAKRKNTHLLDQGLYSSDKASTFRKASVAYAVSKLLEHIKIAVSSHSHTELRNLCSVDNFSVHQFIDRTNDEHCDVVGLDMISPPISLQLVYSLISSSSISTVASTDDNVYGRNVEAVITRHCAFCCATKAVYQDESINDSMLCHSLGVLLNFLFSGESLIETSLRRASLYDDCDDTLQQSRPTKKSSFTSSTSSLSGTQFSTSVSQLVTNLLDCQSREGLAGFRPEEAYSSLELAISDMLLLLQEPNIFLFPVEDVRLRNDIHKLYGCANHVSALTDAFHRVVSSGESEAFMVSGYSGQGKTQLVQSVFKFVAEANGLLVKKKFEETTTSGSNQLSLLLSAFDDLCSLIAETNTEESRHGIYQKLVTQFGTNLYLLVRAVPNVLRLAPSKTVTSSLINAAANENEVNFFSLCDIMKQFMRIISGPGSPVVLFLDDCQWSDPVSLGLIHTVLSDLKGASSVFFVGTYRDNEVTPTHILFGFCEWLSKFQVQLTSIHLGGLAQHDVNFMVSDSLGTFPRLCESLSQIVFHKTKGSPFFIKIFLQSLVDKHLLEYSMREKRWKWDAEKILAENFTPNVLDLLAAKMTNLSGSVQAALKVAACFGIKMNALIAQDLSAAPGYSTLLTGINKAVMDGLMDLDADGSHYRFVHDKVREAAYNMIGSESKNKYHFDIGMALLSTQESRTKGKNYSLTLILDQVNHGVPSLLCDESQRISIAKLNCEASSEAMKAYNYTSAYEYTNTAISLLPTDSWRHYHDLYTELYFLLSKSAYSYRKISEAKDAVLKVLKHADSIETKLDAYVLQHSIIVIDCDPNDAGRLCVKIIDLLESLGEKIPNDDVAKSDIINQVKCAIRSFEAESDGTLLQVHGASSKNHLAIMQAYSILVSLAYIAKPDVYPYYVASWALFHLQYKVRCKYVPVVYVFFAAILCQDMNQDMKSENARTGYRMGQLSLKILNENYSFISELAPLIYVMFYGHVGVLFEPLQACIEMHQKGYDIGLQVGNLSIAAMNKIFLTAREFHAGKNLLKMKEELERDIITEEYHCSFPFLVMKLKTYHQAVCALIGDEASRLPETDQSVFDSEASKLVTQMAFLTYRGYFERVMHMAKQWEGMRDNNQAKKMVNFRAVYVYFYWGLAALVIGRRKKTKWEEIDRLVSIVKNAALCSSWTFSNKVHLLTAEKLSLGSHNREAESAFGAAIAAAQSSHFIHEEGLACELAGLHQERLKNVNKALSLFQQAGKCYKAWGAKMKAQKMDEKIHHLSHRMSSCS